MWQEAGAQGGARGWCSGWCEAGAQGCMSCCLERLDGGWLLVESALSCETKRTTAVGRGGARSAGGRVTSVRGSVPGLTGCWAQAFQGLLQDPASYAWAEGWA